MIATKAIQQRIFDSAINKGPNKPGSVKNLNEMLRSRLEYREKLMLKHMNVARNKALHSISRLDESPEQKVKR